MLLISFQFISSVVVICTQVAHAAKLGANDEAEAMLPDGRPLIIAHRGASGMFPEHTKMAYEEAGNQGADYLECDVVITKDLELICSHEPWLSEVSNVAGNIPGVVDHEDFSDRKSSYNMDDDDPNFDWNDKGVITDFFSFDFTLEELQTLRRKQVREYRDPLYNWNMTFVTLKEYLEISKEHNMGIYPEIKHGKATNDLLKERNHNLTVEELLLRELSNAGYSTAEDPCLVQAFELSTLQNIRNLGSNLRLIFLLHRIEKTTDADLDFYKTLGFYGLGLDKDVLVIKNSDNHINFTNGNLVQRAHNKGLQIHAFTFRNEYHHLAFDFGQDPYKEYDLMMEMQLDGFFTDFPASLNKYLGSDMASRDNGAFNSRTVSLSLVSLGVICLSFLN